MDFENDNETTTKVPSVLQSDGMFSSRILARQSTVGSTSSRIYYRASEGVPFQWEMQPGRAIKPPQDDIMPPLSPPPAVLAMGLPKPCIDVDDEPNKHKRWWSKARLMKMMKKRMHIMEVFHRPNLGGYSISRKILNRSNQGNFGSERYYSESARFSTSSFASNYSTSSSTNYLCSDNNDNPSRSNSSNNQIGTGLAKERAFTCSPRGFSAVVVYFGKRS